MDRYHILFTFIGVMLASVIPAREIPKRKYNTEWDLVSYFPCIERMSWLSGTYLCLQNVIHVMVNWIHTIPKNQIDHAKNKYSSEKQFVYVWCMQVKSIDGDDL